MPILNSESSLGGRVHSLVSEPSVRRPDLGRLDVDHRQTVELSSVPRQPDVVPDLKHTINGY